MRGHRRQLGVLVAWTAVLAGCDCGSPPAIEDSGHRIEAGPPDVGTADAAAIDAAASDGVATDADRVDAALSPRLFVQLDPALSDRVRNRLIALLRAASPLPLAELADGAPGALPPGSWLVAVGDVWATHQLISQAELAAVGAEGYLLRSGQLAGAAALVVDGRPLAPDPFGHPSLGPLHGAYALLERLGFGFLHPLAPVVPARIDLSALQLDVATAPRWPVRGLQLHTMHPLELTDLLQGWGPAGIDDQSGFDAGLVEWERVVEWLVANGQNRVHWPLLEAAPWSAFARSELRRSRFSALTRIAHDYGIAVGADAPIVLQQQHSMRLLTTSGTLEEELAAIRSSVDWLMAAGFDYLATENGTTEFTHPAPDRMLAWMNELARHLDETHHRPALIKIHCSQGQVAAGYLDPETGQPLNFNFLPHYADARLGVAPHTVQIYALDDPAPTYGNVDFSEVRRFLQLEAGRRPVLWHPETAYWVSYDVDVPLFLPVYARQRLRDLRLLASDEEAGRTGRGALAGSPIQGQLTFSSGWEWGYWLNDVVTARAAWDPRPGAVDDDAALQQILDQALVSLGAARGPLIALLVELAEVQHQLLIEGRVAGQLPTEIERRNGIAYLSGVDAWDDVMALGQGLPAVGHITTQPEKLGLVDLRNPLHAPPGYGELAPLLAALTTQLNALADRFDALDPAAAGAAAPLVEEISDAVRVTALRATQVEALYAYVDHDLDPQAADQAAAALARARAALDSAQLLVTLRETGYRVDADRIAGWRTGPTAYSFGYLWTVRRLLYWWRDELKAVQAPLNPCVLNVVNPVTVGVGEGIYADAARIAQELALALPVVGGLSECLAEPATEPTLPPPGLR